MNADHERTSGDRGGNANSAGFRLPESGKSPLDAAGAGNAADIPEANIPEEARDDTRPWGPTEYAGTGSGGLEPRPGDEVIGGGPSGGNESPADERDAEQALRETEDRPGE